MVAAAFHVQLGQRFLQRRLNSGDFFRGVIFLHRRLARSTAASAAAVSIFSDSNAMSVKTTRHRP